MNETIDCSPTEDLDMRAVAWNVTDDWANFKNTVEAASDTNLGSCVENRFAKTARFNVFTNASATTEVA